MIKDFSFSFTIFSLIPFWLWWLVLFLNRKYWELNLFKKFLWSSHRLARFYTLCSTIKPLITDIILDLVFIRLYLYFLLYSEEAIIFLFFEIILFAILKVWISSKKIKWNGFYQGIEIYRKTNVKQTLNFIC